MMVIGESPYLSVVEGLSKTLALLMFLNDDYGLFLGTIHRLASDDSTNTCCKRPSDDSFLVCVNSL